MEARELTYGCHAGLSHGWWLDWYQWGLGVSTSREVGGPLWPNRVDLAIQIGPFQWSASREWAA